MRPRFATRSTRYGALASPCRDRVARGRSEVGGQRSVALMLFEDASDTQTGADAQFVTMLQALLVAVT